MVHRKNRKHCPFKLRQKNIDFCNRYKFNHQSSVSPWPRWMGAFHSGELEFVFGIPLTCPNQYQPQEVELAAQIVDHWTNFVKTG